MDSSEAENTEGTPVKRYWTIAFPGEEGQHVQETWSEDRILNSAWYRNWVLKVVQADRAYLLEDPQIAIDDWKVVHWAMETDQFGNKL